MSHDHTLADELPTIEELGTDLLHTTPVQRIVTLARPFIGLVAYIIAASLGLWWLTPFIVFLIFVAVVTATHDVVHNSIGLNKRQTEWALFLMGAFLLESGHSYRTTHHQHHRVFPSHDDPEGEPARMKFWQAVLAGPLFLPKLWLWAYHQQAGCPAQRRWMVAEALWALGVLLAGIALWRVTPAIAWYAVQVIGGSWVYPLLTVHLPHRDYGSHPLTQTHTLRGTIIPALFLELTYHLEHHLYPMVPSHHLGELSKRLDPLFQEANITRWRVP